MKSANSVFWSYSLISSYFCRLVTGTSTQRLNMESKKMYFCLFNNFYLASDFQYKEFCFLFYSNVYNFLYLGGTRTQGSHACRGREEGSLYRVQAVVINRTASSTLYQMSMHWNSLMNLLFCVQHVYPGARICLLTGFEKRWTRPYRICNLTILIFMW